MLKGVAVDESILFFCFCFFPLETTGVALYFPVYVCIEVCQGREIFGQRCINCRVHAILEVLANDSCSLQGSEGFRM
jgi:hypothetical protein